MQHACIVCFMPKHVQVRNVPDDVVAELKKRAALSGMSLSEFLLRELERIAGRPSRAEVIARIRANAKGTATVEEVVAIIRAGRGPLPDPEEWRVTEAAAQARRSRGSRKPSGRKRAS